MCMVLFTFWINIPLLVLAWKGIGKSFLIKTLIGSAAISIFASIIPIPKNANR